MNIISALVGLSIAGTAMPMIADMSLAPVIAQKRASNFGIAEQRAVTYAAMNEGQDELAKLPDGCELEQAGDGAATITCTEGEGKFKGVVSRTFRTSIDIGGYAGNQRVFSFATPNRYSGHQCPIHDSWGVYGYNDQYRGPLGGDCIPRDVWNRNKYLASSPDAWLYDVNNFQGWGEHPDY